MYMPPVLFEVIATSIVTLEFELVNDLLGRLDDCQILNQVFESEWLLPISFGIFYPLINCFLPTNLILGWSMLLE